MAFAAPLQPDAGEAEVVGEDHGGEIDTPHLDRLAAGGLRFTQGYNTARCWPPRAALLTGYYAQAVRCYVLPGDRGWAKATRPLPWRSLTPEQREFQATKMAIHAALVEAMDREVGRIVRQLEAMHVLDDTLILFASDNGASAEIMIRGEGHDPTAAPGSRKTFLCLGPGWSTCSNAPFRRHKTWVHEGGIATPWIVHWPRGIAAKGALRTRPVHVVDVVPTVLELAGIPPPREHAGRPVPPMQGRSFARSLADPRAPAHEPLWWCHEGNRGVRAGDWKLVESKGAGWELYDLANDRCETRNLAASEPGRVKDLAATWDGIAVACRTLAADEASAPVHGGRR